MTRAMSDSEEESAEEEEEEEEEMQQQQIPAAPIQSALAKAVHNAITADAQLYHRILLLEPIPFEEVWSTLLRCSDAEIFKTKARGVVQAQVKAWLDLQGIVWYEGDVTGTRARH